jgi:hypothetical protein
MSLQRTLIFITGVFFAVGIAASQASAQCQLAIEINALRGGSPTVTVGGTKKITAKARIMKGTAVKGTSLVTTLEIEAEDDTGVFNRQTSAPHDLVVGKGGQGGSITFDITQCVGGTVDFIATFFGNDGNGLCEASRTITKDCK